MRKYLAEMLGTMILVLMGCGSAIFAGNAADALGAGVGTLGVALAFGLSVVAMAYTIGNVSGCHINPAITLGVWMSGRMSTRDAAMYMIFQVIGALSVRCSWYFLFLPEGMADLPCLVRIRTTLEKWPRLLLPRQCLPLFLYWWYWVRLMKRRERVILPDLPLA